MSWQNQMQLSGNEESAFVLKLRAEQNVFCECCQPDIGQWMQSAMHTQAVIHRLAVCWFLIDSINIFITHPRALICCHAKCFVYTLIIPSAWTLKSLRSPSGWTTSRPPTWPVNKVHQDTARSKRLKLLPPPDGGSKWYAFKNNYSRRHADELEQERKAESACVSQTLTVISIIEFQTITGVLRKKGGAIESV